MNTLHNLDALLISNPVNVRYLTGFIGANPVEHEVYLLLYKDVMYLFTNSLYIERANQIALKKPNIRIVQISRNTTLTSHLRQIMKESAIHNLGFEAHATLFTEYIDFAKNLKGVKLIPTIDRIEDMRMMKTEAEIKSIRIACALTDACYTYIQKFIKKNVSEMSIANKINQYFTSHHAESAFDPIVAFGKNGSQPHYMPDNSVKLQPGDTILIDMGAKVNGYCADMTRMLTTKSSESKEFTQAYQAVLDAHDSAIQILIKKYETKTQRIDGALLDDKAKAVIKKAGFIPYSHSLGHNVGLAIHEKPRLTKQKPEMIKPGMVFSIEPGIYLPGKFGIRIEDLVYLSENGVEILSKAPLHVQYIKI